MLQIEHECGDTWLSEGLPNCGQLNEKLMIAIRLTSNIKIAAKFRFEGNQQFSLL